jgi:prophage maintenance system killer protein/transcriptional regulator with XRE-family HTH domain
MLKRGLNQAQVARSLGVSREAVSRWFRTGSLPKPATLVALGDLLQLPVETIVVSSEVKVRLGGRRVVGEAPSEYMATAIVLYEQPEGGVRIDVKLQNDTLWLNLNQIADLFGRDKSVISRHLRNIYDEGELARESTVASFATVQSEGARQVERQTEFYNLDAILSVGYRVNSKRGTQFRLWATSVLRDHIVKGYTVNARRLKELNQVVRLIADMAGRRALEGEEATALLRLAADYSFALELLDDYDHQRVAPAGVTRDVVYPVDYEEAVRIVGRLRERYGAGDLFGREKDNSLQSALGAVVQSFGGRDVYPTLEEKAANLLYFLVKNHPFVDGNKRIGAALFLWFMDKNGALCRADGSKRLADTALVAMVLLIAESKPSEKDLLCRVLVHLIVRGDG